MNVSNPGSAPVSGTLTAKLIAADGSINDSADVPEFDDRGSYDFTMNPGVSATGTFGFLVGGGISFKHVLFYLDDQMVSELPLCLTSRQLNGDTSYC
ncbi:hypothetical protein ABH923_000304 [Leifsonia sp. EB41]|uniref:hypothetical protein n=1 Tax=Leifsonia sp. EB41 TaxID=3156260 RepID=UPI003519B9F2